MTIEKVFSPKLGDELIVVTSGKATVRGHLIVDGAVTYSDFELAPGDTIAIKSAKENMRVNIEAAQELGDDDVHVTNMWQMLDDINQLRQTEEADG